VIQVYTTKYNTYVYCTICHTYNLVIYNLVILLLKQTIATYLKALSLYLPGQLVIIPQLPRPRWSSIQLVKYGYCTFGVMIRIKFRYGACCPILLQCDRGRSIQCTTRWGCQRDYNYVPT